MARGATKRGPDEASTNPGEARARNNPREAHERPRESKRGPMVADTSKKLRRGRGRGTEEKGGTRRERRANEEGGKGWGGTSAKLVLNLVLN